MEVGAVMQPDLGLDVPVVEVEAGGVAGESVIRDGVACLIELSFRRAETVSSGECRPG